MSAKITPGEVSGFLDALVGDTGANGDTRLDDESMGNMPLFSAVCDWVANRLDRTLGGNEPREYSSRRVRSVMRGVALDLVCSCVSCEPDYAREVLDEIDETGDEL